LKHVLLHGAFRANFRWGTAPPVACKKKKNANRVGGGHLRFYPLPPDPVRPGLATKEITSLTRAPAAPRPRTQAKFNCADTCPGGCSASLITRQQRHGVTDELVLWSTGMKPTLPASKSAVPHPRMLRQVERSHPHCPWTRPWRAGGTAATARALASTRPSCTPSWNPCMLACVGLMLVRGTAAPERRRQRLWSDPV